MRAVSALSFLAMLAGCGTKSTLDLGGGGSPSPTPTVSSCSVPGNICSLGPTGIGDGGDALSATLFWPYGAATDAAGNIYIADTMSHRIRRIDSATGVIETIAGTGELEYPTRTGLPALETVVAFPLSVAVSPDGWVYWWSSGWWERDIFGIDPASGNVVLIAGTGSSGSASNGPALLATFSPGEGALSVDASGNLYVADAYNHVVRVINRGEENTTVAGITIEPGHIGTIAGTGSAGSSSDGTAATSAKLNRPMHAFPTSAGSILIADHDNHRVLLVGSSGNTTTVAGSGIQGSSGDGGPATSADFNRPVGVTADAAGRMFVLDRRVKIRMVNLSGADLSFGAVTVAAGEVETVAGIGWGFPFLDGGPALQQRLSTQNAPPILLPSGNLLVVDTWNGVLREAGAQDGTMSIISGFSGGTTIAEFRPWIASLALSPSGAVLFETGNAYLASYEPSTGEIVNVAGTGSPDDSGDGGPASSAGLFVDGIATTTDGSIYIADGWNYEIRRIDPGGTITTVAGTGVKVDNGAGDGGPAVSAAFDHVDNVAVDGSGNLFILDDEFIRVVNRTDGPITVAGVTIQSGNIDWIAGTPGTSGYGGDGGPAKNALFNLDYTNAGLVIAGDSLFVADFDNHRIRRVDLSTGVITTFAGNGSSGYRGDGGLPAYAEVGKPTGLAVHDGFLYWAQEKGAVVRRTPLDGTGPVETVAGSGEEGFSGDGGPATSAKLHWPQGVAFGPDGTLYIADSSKRIRTVAPPFP